MEKFRNSEIKTFQFSDLQGTHVISPSKLEPFNFKELNGEVFNKEKISEDKVRIERSHEQNSSFRIDEKVRTSRGLAGQEQSDFENRIQDEVERRLKITHQEAYNSGLAQGREQGQAEAFAQYQAGLSENTVALEEVINAIKTQGNTVLEENRQEVYEFIKRFTKWIIFKEIDPKVYLEQLLEKLILELNARRNLIIKVGRENFSQMPEVIQAVESKLGQLSNVRVEIVPEIKYPGIILESENSLIDGSLETVFLNIDKIFGQVTKNE
jgi:flagellar assembly protein FliH